jgi:pyridoxine/pyridoxamine 5'-phosphate oxidase
MKSETSPTRHNSNTRTTIQFEQTQPNPPDFRTDIRAQQHPSAHTHPNALQLREHLGDGGPRVRLVLPTTGDERDVVLVVFPVKWF